MDLNASAEEEMKGFNREMFSVDCEPALEKFENILASKLKEFIREKTANQRSERTWIYNQVKILLKSKCCYNSENMIKR